MKSRLSAITFIAIPLFAVCAAHGQATRTYVSGVGDDANPCSRTAPCKTFAGAISKTAPSGEINVLDPGGFGAVTITKALTIDGGGFTAGVLVSGTNAIIINAGSSDVVTLRNLDIDGLQTGINGVLVLQAKAVHIENSTIFGFATSGINVSPASTTTVSIDHTFLRENANSGITLAGGGGTVTAMITNSSFTDNGVGLSVGGGSKVTVQNSVASGNAGAGFSADGSSGAATLNIVNSVSANNTGPGVQASSTGASTAVVRLTGVSTFSNSVGLSAGTNGNIFSFGDNSLTGAGTPTGTLTKQ